MTLATYVSKDDEKAIVHAIEEAEKASSGEIRVHLEENCKTDPLDRAAVIFAKLKMHKTELRNGVLFYLAFKDKKFGILGDVGINSVVPADFWDNIKDTMIPLLAEGNFTGALSIGIQMAGEKLKQFFPCQKNDQNELSNEISFS
jgi:uncharacterized membrane protein